MSEWSYTCLCMYADCYFRELILSSRRHVITCNLSFPLQSWTCFLLCVKHQSPTLTGTTFVVWHKYWFYWYFKRRNYKHINFKTSFHVIRQSKWTMRQRLPFSTAKSLKIVSSIFVCLLYGSVSNKQTQVCYYSQMVRFLHISRDVCLWTR